MLCKQIRLIFLIGTNVTITRDRQMSLAMQGSFSLTYEGVTIEAPIYSSQYDLFPLMDTNWGFGCDLTSWGHCWEKHYLLSWTCEGGNKPSITVDKNITSDGTNIDFGMWQNGDGFDDGFLFIEQMGPDFFRWVKNFYN